MRKLAAIAMILLVVSAGAAWAQVPSLLDAQNAERTRQTLEAMFRQYPPSLREILRLDPSLLTNPDYLAPYPGFEAFLKAHPEVAHNPGYFIGTSEIYVNRFRNPQPDTARVVNEIMMPLAIVSVIITIAMFIVSIFKTAIDHRRWLRITNLQTEVHSKLLDRFTANQDLMAYMQTDAGKRFLEFAPVSTGWATQPLSSPVNRILWSIQAGVVLAMAGFGLQYASQSVVGDASQVLTIVGVLALAVGIGFVLSALIAYVMSQRLGLIHQTGETPPHA